MEYRCTRAHTHTNKDTLKVGCNPSGMVAFTLELTLILKTFMFACFKFPTEAGIVIVSKFFFLINSFSFKFLVLRRVMHW